MPRKILRSVGHAYSGLRYAFRTERNIRLFVSTYTLLVLLAFLFQFGASEWLAFLLSGGLFLSTELLNTGLERIADAVDDHCKQAHQSHCFTALMHTKDLAASASLISLAVVIVTVLILFVPHIKLAYSL